MPWIARAENGTVKLRRCSSGDWAYRVAHRDLGILVDAEGAVGVAGWHFETAHSGYFAALE
jgi:hypothetical protein